LFAVNRAKRATGSRCPANQLTAPKVAGYDADTGELVVSRDVRASPPALRRRPRRTELRAATTRSGRLSLCPGGSLDWADL
jgi:hypothetical protein